MLFQSRKALTLVESLVSMLLLSVLLVSILGAFFIAQKGISRARHRYTAMKIIRQYMEREFRAGYDGGNDAEGDYYVTFSSAVPVNVTIDDRGTAGTADDLIGTIAPDPYYPDNIYDAGGGQLTYSGIPYKIAGFVVTWTEDAASLVCTERAVSYVVYHSSA